MNTKRILIIVVVLAIIGVVAWKVTGPAPDPADLPPIPTSSDG